ncbi:MAG TPA: YihY/virulence factor BrkB family protein [Actinomycetota bacterium]|jgi:membrane protein
MERIKRLIAQAQLVLERARARYGVVDIVVRTFKRFSEDEGGPRSAALTYYIFFSIFPLLLFAVSGLGYVAFLSEPVKKDLIDAGVEAFPMLRDVLSPNGLDQIVQNRGTLAGLGFVLALYAGTGVVLAMEHALNRIHHVEDEGNFFQKRLWSLKWLGMLGLAAAATVVAGTLANVVVDVMDGGAAAAIVAVLLLGVGFLLNLLVFMSAFRFLTRKEQSWRDVFPGALVGAIAFEILKYFGAAYIERGSQAREATFGAFATTAAFLVASYLLSQIILLSAELNAVLGERRTTRQSAKAS